MSVRFRGIKLSKKALYVCLALLMVVGVSLAIVFATLSSRENKLIIKQEVEENFETIDSEPLVNASGWNTKIMSKLTKNLDKFDDNMALGNADGITVSSIVSLAGIKWVVVYKQNNVITLLANESVATLPYNEVSEFLNGEFYSAFCEAVGYDNIEELILPFGTTSTYFQLAGAQAVQIETINGYDILNNDGEMGDLFWIPSAYELGGFKNTEYSPQARANSFDTVSVGDVEVNAGLYNLSNSIRLAVDNAWLRGEANDSNIVLTNGIVETYSGLAEVRPCVNIKLPEQKTAQNDGSFSSASNEPKLATFTGPWTTNGSGYYQISSRADLIALSQAVLDGNTFSGKTFVLTTDLDFTGYTFWLPIGYRHPTNTAAAYNKAFSGVFDGQGYKISNLSSANSGFAGLFGYVLSGTIKNVGVEKSSWYTRSTFVGGIVGYASKTLVDCCYNDCGVSGYNYVGGIVGAWYQNATNKIISNCYNSGAVSGVDYVGGIVGGLSTSSSPASPPIKYCYNKGLVLASTANVDGISVTGTFTSVYSFNATCRNSSSNLTYAQMRTQSSFSSFNFTSTWYMPKSLNERMPLLRVFIHSIKVYTYAYVNSYGLLNPTVDTTCVAKLYNSGGTAEIASSVMPAAYYSNGVSTNYAKYYTATPSTTYKVRAESKFATGKHYCLEGWYYAELGYNGLPINFVATGWSAPTVTEGSSSTVYAISQSFTEDVVLVAKFNRLFCFQGYETARGYTFSGSDYTPHVTVSYKDSSNNDATPYNAKGNAWTSGNKWFVEGTILTIRVSIFDGKVYSQTLYTTSYNGEIPAPSNMLKTSYNMNYYVSGGGDRCLEITLQDTSTYKNAYNTALPAGDELYIYMDTFRQLTITLGAVFGTSGTNAINATTYGNVNITLQVIDLNGTNNSSRYLTAGNDSSATYVTTGDFRATEKVKPISLSSPTNYDNTKLVFKSWKLYYSSADKMTLTAGTEYDVGDGLKVLPYTITQVYIYARFAAQSQSVTLAESSGQESYGMVRIQTGNLTAANSTITAEAKTVTATVGTTYYIYVLPDWSNFYDFNTISVSAGGVSVTLSKISNTTTGLYKGSFKLTSKPSSAITYTISYKTRADLQIQYTLEATDVPSDNLTNITIPSNLTGKNKDFAFTTNSSTGIKLTFANGVQEMYYLAELQKKCHAGTNANTWQTLGTASEPSSPSATVYLVNYMGSTTTVGTLLTACSDVASYQNSILYLKLIVVPFAAQKINYTVKADGTANQTVSSLVTIKKQLSGSSTTQTVSNGRAEINSTVTVEIVKVGYTVTKVTPTGVTFSTVPTVGTNRFGTKATAVFTMPAKTVSIAIEISSKTYNLYCVDNLGASSNSDYAQINNYNSSQTVVSNNSLAIELLNISEPNINTFSNSITRSNPSKPSSWGTTKIGYEATDAVSGHATTHNFGTPANPYTVNLVSVKLFGHRTASSKQYYDTLKTWTTFTSISFTVNTSLCGSTNYKNYTDLVLVFIYDNPIDITIEVTIDVDAPMLVILKKKDNSGNVVSTLSPVVVQPGESKTIKLPGTGNYEVEVAAAMNIKIIINNKEGTTTGITIASGNNQLEVGTDGTVGGGEISKVGFTIV